MASNALLLQPVPAVDAIRGLVGIASESAQKEQFSGQTHG
jgi:hypothetical protein